MRPSRRILTSYSKNAERSPGWVHEILNSQAETAARALEAEGAEVIFVDASRTTDDPSELIRGVDGVIILGGTDLDPATYGQERQDDSLYGMDSHADTFELQLAVAVINTGLPFLGICRGMQVLNVALGGTLTQDLGPGTMHHRESEESPMTDHGVRIRPGTLLESIYSTAALPIRSGHHQAVATIGEGLTASADATDGTIEAIEGSKSWVLGVQWHPEDPAADAQQLQTLAAAFARKCEYLATATTPHCNQRSKEIT